MAKKEYIEREEPLKETVRKIKANNERRMAVVDKDRRSRQSMEQEGGR